MTNDDVMLFEALPWQIEPWKDKSPIVLLTGSGGGGKALALDTKVVTARGLVPMGDVHVGDTVYAIDGKPTRVIAETGVMQDRQCYEVEFSTGERVTCDAGHEWVVSKDGGKLHVQTARDLARHVTRQKGNRYAVPVCGTVERDSRDLPLSPWLLGFLLGDGYLPQMTFTTADPEIAARVAQEVPGGHEVEHVGNAGNPYTYIIRSGLNWDKSRDRTVNAGRVYPHRLSPKFCAIAYKDQYLGMFDTEAEGWAAIEALHGGRKLVLKGCGIHYELNRLGLRECRSGDKFIPDVYKHTSAHQRLELLRGLMDADGHIQPGRGRTEFTVIGERLARDVFGIVCSLGIKAHIHEKPMVVNGEPYKAWRVQFTSHVPVFWLARKAAHVRDRTRLRKTQFRRYIVGVKRVASVPVKCIQTEAGTYLVTESHIPTHNSRLCAEKAHAFCLKYPGAMALAVRKTRESMNNSTVLFIQRAVIGDDPRVTFVPSKSRFEYWNGSILAWGGMNDDKQREQIRSIGQDGGLDFVWMEEATRFVEDDLNEVLGRMRGKAAPWMQVILSTNPDAPSHWIKKRLIDGGEAAVYYSSASDNSHNPAQYVDNLGKLTGVLGERLREGRWVQAEGAIYFDFRDEVHTIEPFVIPANWRRIRSVDFGYTNPFVAQWWAVDDDDRMYLYREIYMTNRTVRSHTERIAELSRGERIEATVADHDAEDRATMAEGGVKTTAAKKAVSVGIQEVMDRLKVAGDGRPRLFIFRGATVEIDQSLEERKLPVSTLEEMTLYTWEDKAKKEQPVKEHDHGMDAMRYAAMYLKGKNTWSAYSRQQ